ncbi:hypothetical protein ACO1O0_007562 [Amphichorda felina]
MIFLVRTLALTGAIASGVLANAPLSDYTRIETAQPQELGFMTSDGYLVYSMNYCTIIQTTICNVTLSTGVPVPVSDTPSSTQGVPSTVVITTPTVDPAPTGSGEPTSAASGTHSHSHSSGETTEATTSTEATGTPTGSAPSTESIGVGAVVDAFQAGVFGAAGMAAALLV